MRVRIGDGAYAAIWPHLSIIGPILDISPEGVSFWYLAREESTAESSRLIISSSDEAFHGKTFPFEPVWDEPWQSDVVSGYINRRRCGLRFGLLSDEQKEAIWSFIDTHGNINKLRGTLSGINTILLTGFGDEKVQQAAEALDIAYFQKDQMHRFWRFIADMEKNGPNILIVDDEKKFLYTLSDRIRIKGFEPLLATSGKEAVEIARTHRIHAAVVDLKMPDMDGFATINKLKNIQNE